MRIPWKDSFARTKYSWTDAGGLVPAPKITTLEELKYFLDIVHIRHCLLRPYCEIADYPLVEARELLPSFEPDLWEHKLLPSFSLAAFARPLEYMNEVFQYDALVPAKNMTDGSAYPRNIQTLQSRLPRKLQEQARQQFAKTDVTSLANYPSLLPYALSMDRGQVMALQQSARGAVFCLAGIYASFPSDLDTEIKRYGLRINKFAVGDSRLYAQNRHFVYQRLMELYGFPVASERRTSAALFARRLHKMGERFLIRVLGQSDRTITTIWNPGEKRYYPRVEKIALVALDRDLGGCLDEFADRGFMVDAEKCIVIMRVRYKQHKFNADNVRQERALSVESHELIHPLTGETLQDISVLRDSTSMFLRLNDIVRGEYSGRIVYKRNEIIENTDTEEKRLKFLYAWLSKHQRRIIGYGDEFFANISKILYGYLVEHPPEEPYGHLFELHKEVAGKISYIQQARKVRLLEELRDRLYKGRHLSYHRMLVEVVAHLHELKFEIVSYFATLVATVIHIGESILSDRYLLRSYITKRDDALSRRGREIKKNYGKLVSLIDAFKAVQRAKTNVQQRHM